MSSPGHFAELLHFLLLLGDLKLAAFFPIHKSEQNDVCGEIQREDGIQPLEAMLFTLDEINRDENLLPGIKLGAIAIDSCDDSIRATEKALPLLKCFMRKKVGFPNFQGKFQVAKLRQFFPVKLASESLHT